MQEPTTTGKSPNSIRLANFTVICFQQIVNFLVDCQSMGRFEIYQYGTLCVKQRSLASLSHTLFGTS